MTHPNDHEVQQRIARLLDLMGRMIQEVGGLISAPRAGELAPVESMDRAAQILTPPPAAAPPVEPRGAGDASTGDSPVEEGPTEPDPVVAARQPPQPGMTDSHSAPPPAAEPPAAESPAAELLPAESPPAEPPAAELLPAESPAGSTDEIARRLDAEFAAMLGEEDEDAPGRTWDLEGETVPETEPPVDSASRPTPMTEPPVDSAPMTEIEGPGEQEPPADRSARPPDGSPQGVSKPEAIEEVPDAGMSAGPDPVVDSGRLYLVCVGEADQRLAIPWGWIAETQLSEAGAPEAFVLNDGEHVRRLRVKRVRGIWSAKELHDWTDDISWVTHLSEMPTLASTWAQADAANVRAPEGETTKHTLREEATESVSGETPPAAPPATRREAPRDVPGEAAPQAAPRDVPGEAAPQAAPRDVAGEAALQAAPRDVAGEMPREASRPSSGPPAPGEEPPRGASQVWVVSPSALARRFLMRHLDGAGIEVLEARDLDDPLLPADLEGAGALFLDESLRDHWSTHPAFHSTRVPLILLTVDGTLRVPAAGVYSSEGAALPRPFERTEVESVVTWLRSLWQDESAGGSVIHADAQNDTWLFADPFGNRSSGNGPGGR